MESPRWLNAQQAADRLHFPSAAAFTEYCRRHGCSARVKVGKRWLYDPAQLDLWAIHNNTPTYRRLRRAS